MWQRLDESRPTSSTERRAYDELAKAFGPGFNGPLIKVSGTTAVDIDMAEKIQGALLPYLATVVGLAVLLLAAVFRSILIPVKAALGFLLSVVAALGAMVRAQVSPVGAAMRD